MWIRLLGRNFAVCTLSDYSVEFGPYLKGIMTDRTSEVSAQKPYPHLNVASCQVHELREQETVVRLMGDNLGFVCHVAIHVSNDDRAHYNTVCTQQLFVARHMERAARVRGL